jgi:plastocyanin
MGQSWSATSTLSTGWHYEIHQAQRCSLFHHVNISFILPGSVVALCVREYAQKLTLLVLTLPVLYRLHFLTILQRSSSLQVEHIIMKSQFLPILTPIAAFNTSLVAVQITTATVSTLALSNPTSTTSTSPTAKTWTINVGKGDHTFRPDTIQANIGDTIEFDFFPANHSVVRAEYQYPCIPYELTGKGKVGFFSGFHPVDAILDDPPTWSVTVNDSDPIFFYCSAPGSCLDYQMVGVINPNASVSLQTQKQAANDAKYMLQPGDSFPIEGGDITGSPSSITTTATAVPKPSTNSLSAGAIAGIVVGAIVLLILAASLTYFIGRTKTVKKQEKALASLPAMQQQYGAGAAGHLSPVSPPTAPLDPYSNGTVYIPIKATDFAEFNRQSGGTPQPEVGEVRDYDDYSVRSPDRRLEERQVWPPIK